MKKYVIGALIASGIFYYGMCNKPERAVVKHIIKRSYKHSKEHLKNFFEDKAYNPNADNYMNKNRHEENKIMPDSRKKKLHVQLDNIVMDSFA